jgi:hypothetical protein
VVAAPVIVLVLLYAVLIVTPIPLPFVSSQVRNLVLGSMPEGSQLELGDMALALEGYVWPVIRFSPVTYTDVKTGGTVSMEALEVGFSPVRAIVGQPGATVTIVGPHLQVNQDLFGPRLAKFELVDEPDGSRTVRVIEGQDQFPELDISSKGMNVQGVVPDPKLGIRSDNDWLVYNMEAAGNGIAGIIAQAKAGNFSKLVVRDGVLDMNDALYGVFRTFRDINVEIAPSADAKSASGNYSVDFNGTRMNGMVEWVGSDASPVARIQASITNFDPGAFSPMVGDKSAAATAVGTMSVSMDIGFDTVAKKVTDGLFHMDMTGMDVKLPDNTYVPIVTSIAEVRWDPIAGQFTMGDTTVNVGGNTAIVSGTFVLGLDTQYGPIVSIALTGRDISISSDLGPPKEPFSEMDLAAWSAPLYGAMGIDNFQIRKADGSAIAAQGRVDMLLDGIGFKMDIVGDGISADDLKRVWPPMMAADARNWFVKNVIDGKLKKSTMRYNFPVGAIDTTGSGESKPLPPGSMSIDIVGENVKIKPTETMDPVTLDGETRLSLRDSDITMSATGASIATAKGPIGLANVAFVIGSDPAAPGDVIYEISGDLASGIPALLDLAKTQQPDMLKSETVPIDLNTVSGKVSLSLVATIVNDKATGANKRLDYVINGIAQDLGSTAPIQGHTIGDGQLSFVASQAGYKVTGQAALDGIGVDVVVDGKLEKDAPMPNVVVSSTFDNADLRKFGFDASQFFSGTVKVAARPLADGTIQVAADLDNAAITIKDLGIAKAKGTNGSAKAAIKLDGEIAEVSQVDVSFGTVSLQGSITADLKKGLQEAQFTRFALSEGDSAQLNLKPIDGGYKLTLRGDQLDMKPMLQRFFSLSGDSTGGPTANAVNTSIVADIELKRALGFYKTTAFNLNLDLSLKGADLRKVNLQANLGGDRSISVTTNPTPDGKVMSVAFNDLGTLLRLMNIYPNVEGGEGSLVVQTVDAEKLDSGRFTLKNFAFVNEKNVSKIVGNHRDSDPTVARSGKLAFRSGEVEFIRRKDRVEITDAVLAGDTVGGTARGFIYTDEKRYDMTGTYVPLFGLNNAFSKLLGPFAGRDGEGLFGVTFAIKGPLDKPDFKINPMSALVPGAFRRMFEYRAKEIPRVD